MPDMQKFFRSSAAKTSADSSTPSFQNRYDHTEGNSSPVRKSLRKIKLTVAPKPKASPSPEANKSDPFMSKDNLCSWTDQPAPLQRSASCGLFSCRTRTPSFERSASGGLFGRRAKGEQMNDWVDDVDEDESIHSSIECKPERRLTKKAVKLPFKPLSIKGSPSSNTFSPKEALDEIVKKKSQRKTQDRSLSRNQIYAEQKKTRCFFEAADAMRSESASSMDSFESAPDLVPMSNWESLSERSSCSEKHFVEEDEVNGEFYPTYDSEIVRELPVFC